MSAVAAPAGSLDEAVPWHHGDPLAEQRTAARGCVVVDRSNRDVLVVPGADRLSWLHSLLSQHLTELSDGAATEALLLDGNGRVERHLVLADVGGRVWLDTEPGHGAELLTYLERMRFWSVVEPAASDHAVLSLLGPATPGVLAAAGLPEVADGRAAAHGDDVLVRRLDWRTMPAVDVLVPRAAAAGWLARLGEAGARPAGTLAYEALRVEALRPRIGVDTDVRTIPHEANWIGTAVHLEKGCYRGQETVARVANLGRPPRRLLLLHLDGSDDLPATGDDVTLDGRVVGRVGTVVQHHELGPVALALVKNSTPVDAALTAGPAAASVDPDSVPPDTGEPAGRAALRRLRG
ncbi:MAG TPA: folate-binding protein [Pseudonocardiaceae bacterium]